MTDTSASSAGSVASGGAASTSFPPAAGDVWGTMMLELGGWVPEGPPAWFFEPSPPDPDDVVPIEGDSHPPVNETDLGVTGPDPNDTAPPSVDPIPGQEVVPIAGDSSGPDTTDVVPIAGDSSGPAPSGPPPGPNFFLFGPMISPYYYDDDDDDDEDGNSSLLIWFAAAVVLAVVVVAGLSGYFIWGAGKSSTGGPTAKDTPTTAPVKTDASACPPGQKLQQLTLNGAPVRCAGPAQYPTDTSSTAYSYYAAEFHFHPGDVQLVVTGPPLTIPLTVQISPTFSAQSAGGSPTAVVDLYDNNAAKENLATSGSVMLNPNGSVVFNHVVVTYYGQPIVISGDMVASFASNGSTTTTTTTTAGNATTTTAGNATTTTAAPTTTTTAAASAGAKATASSAYLDDVAPANLALENFAGAIQHFNSATTASSAQRAAAPLLTALRSSASKLRRLAQTYPPAKAALIQQAGTLDTLESQLHTLSELRTGDVGPFILKYETDITALKQASNAVRSALGLPAT